MRWAGATDALDNSVWWAGKQGGTRDTEGADAATVLESRFDPLISASTPAHFDRRQRASGMDAAPRKPRLLLIYCCGIYCHGNPIATAHRGDGSPRTCPTS
jgi:hypothetical protein